MQLGLRLGDLGELLLGRARDEVVAAVEPEVRQCRGEDGGGDAGRLEEDLELVGLEESAFARRMLSLCGCTVISMPSSARIRAAKETACSGLI